MGWQRLSSPGVCSTVRRLGAAGLLVYSTVASAGVIPVVENGKLIGADNVDVGNLGLYKFRLAYGSCVRVFGSNCAPDKFTFSNARDAALAAQALLDQVLVGRYDDGPGDTTFGCTNTLGCTISTPFGIESVPYQWGYTDSTGTYTGVGYTRFTQVADATNWAAYFHFPGGFSPRGYPDDVQIHTGSEISFVGRYGEATLFAIWERQGAPASVPEPSSLATTLLGLPLIAALALRRRSRRKGT
jgi:hypothetical protein